MYTYTNICKFIHVYIHICICTCIYMIIFVSACMVYSSTEQLAQRHSNHAPAAFPHAFTHTHTLSLSLSLTLSLTLPLSLSLCLPPFLQGMMHNDMQIMHRQHNSNAGPLPAHVQQQQQQQQQQLNQQNYYQNMVCNMSTIYRNIRTYI